ncbi:Gldg family protein [Aliikangiella maris]|uniref:Gldg family protein n=2 Tax=Aliikangiella maris TaxID=3162458 RepID=A0ABV3MSJ8_9GAMM
MLPNNANTLIRRIAAKEIALFFASPIAYLFLATFAAVTLFTFFWAEAFFARNIADVRPLFEWMPLLLIFLSSTLTMRLWSEERRTGTLEHVLTQPVALWHFVVGKFSGCLALLAIALLITLPLPITVALIGDLDWGPVLAGYLATFLLGAAYLSIGLFVSARSDNQIVSLISAVALCGVFYLIGTPMITDFFGNQSGEWLRLLGTGSRFESITRGVIDLRDLYYYISIILVFLSLNAFVLERERWATLNTTPHHTNWRVVTALLLLNALGANLWLGQINLLRIDATEGNQYSISPATQQYLNQLQEPLLIRGYFSNKTHPLLAPLVPQLKDLIKEYEVAGRGKVLSEIIDPISNPELEEEANQKYGIQPSPFQVADRYQSSIVSSYFNILIQYGDEHQVLGFRDLIEVKSGGATDIDVQLRNPEHDLTRSIKKVLNSYQSGGNLFDTIQGKLVFNAYLSNEQALPEQLVNFKQVIEKVTADLKKQANDSLTINMIDPDANGGAIAQQIAEDFGFQPMATNLFSNDHFYFYLTLTKDEQIVQIPLDDMTESSFKRNLEAGIKRFASGFTKTVGLVVPQQDPQMAQFGMAGPQFNLLEQFISTDLNVKKVDLSAGRVDGDIDFLILMSPKAFDDKQLFAIDQFLMQGGTVFIATSPFSASFTGRRLAMLPHESGLTDWLKHHGLTIDNQLVMDPQNAAFPVPITRNVGGFQLQEMRMLDYPYFIDARNTGLNQDNPITANLPQATIAWASPIKVNQESQNNRQITELVKSSAGAWLSDSTDIMPKVDANGVSGFSPQGETKEQLIGVISEGQFDSYFAGKQSPLLSAKTSDTDEEDSANQSASDSEDSASSNQVVSSVIDKSAESARIVLFSSNDFLSDQIIQMTSSASGSEYLSTLQLVANSIDWSLEDAGLLSIRSRGHFNRTLPPMEQDAQMFWEYLNYILAAFALAIVALIQKQRKRAQNLAYAQLLSH